MIREKSIGEFTLELLGKFAPVYNRFKGLKDSRRTIEEFCVLQQLQLEDLHAQHRGKYTVGGTTNGSVISVAFGENHFLNYYLFFHEMAHLNLHFTQDGSNLTAEEKEQEADIVAAYMCSLIFPDHYEKIIDFARDNPALK